MVAKVDDGVGGSGRGNNEGVDNDDEDGATNGDVGNSGRQRVLHLVLSPPSVRNVSLN